MLIWFCEYCSELIRKRVQVFFNFIFADDFLSRLDNDDDISDAVLFKCRCRHLYYQDINVKIWCTLDRVNLFAKIECYSTPEADRGEEKLLLEWTSVNDKEVKNIFSVKLLNKKKKLFWVKKMCFIICRSRKRQFAGWDRFQIPLSRRQSQNLVLNRPWRPDCSNRMF